MKKILILFSVSISAMLLSAGTLQLAKKGKANAVIVLPDKPNPVARYAASELISHLQMITGAELRTVPESKYDGKLFPIYLGATRAAEKAGLGQDKFDKEAWAIRSTPKALYLTGGENELELMNFRTPATTFQETSDYWKSNGGFNRLARRGTLYSVTEFLQKICGVRWLWPGELGTLYTRNPNLSIADNLNINGAPRFLYREWWIRGKTCPYFKPGYTNTWSRAKIDNITGQLFFSQPVFDKFFEATRRFLLLYQEGDSEPLPAPGKILDEALKAAAKSKDKNHLERVKFIRLGWLHGKMCVEFSHLYKNNKFTEARKKLNEIIAFRRKYEDTFFCDLAAAFGAESRGYKGLKDFMTGKFRNFHAPKFQWKNFKRSECHEIKGFKPSTWSLALPEKVNSGHIVFKYDAGMDNSFVEAELNIFARNLNVTNVLAISFDNKNWQNIGENIARKKFDLTKLVKDKQLFYLKFSSARKPGKDKTEMTLISFRLDFTRKNPDVVPVRKKPVLGTGWLDFNSQWFYRKDLHNKGLSKTDMNVKTFSSKDWIPVKVPAKLDSTPVGPYLGHGWYSTVFDVRKDWAGRSIDILFTAIDKEGWVYFNGHYVGEHTVKSEKVGVGILYDEPFIIKVPPKYINFGGKNLLQVKTYSAFGASGIWKPVKIRPVDASATY